MQLHTLHAREVKRYKWHARGVNVNGTQGALILREERPMSVGRMGAMMFHPSDQWPLECDHCSHMFEGVVNLNKCLHKTNQWFRDKVFNFAIPTGGILGKPWSLHPPAVPISVRRHQDWWLLHSPPNTSAPVSTWLQLGAQCAYKRAQSSNVHIWYSRLAELGL